MSLGGANNVVKLLQAVGARIDGRGGARPQVVVRAAGAGHFVKAPVYPRHVSALYGY